MMRHITYLVPFLVLLNSCMSLSMKPVYVSKLQVAPPTLMIARKSQAPLLIVLDPQKVPDQVIIPEGELKEIKVFEVRTFVQRDLKDAMLTFFQTVEVVAPGFTPPEEPYWVADVRVDKLGTKVFKAVNANNAAQVAAEIHGEITWAFAMRPNTVDDYVYSFAGSSVGSYSMTHVSQTDQMFASAFESAVTSMVKGMVDKKVDLLQPIDEEPAVEEPVVEESVMPESTETNKKSKKTKKSRARRKS